VSAREEILARIRSARPAVSPPVPRDYRTDRPEETDGELLDLLVDRLVDYRATVRRCSAGELPAAVAELLAGVPQVALPPGVPADWLGSYHGRVVRDGEPRPLTVGDLDAPGLAVVTGCAVAIAQTGTLILDAAPDQGRRLLSLVPDHHLCVVHAGQIVAGVPAALARLADPTRPLTLVSGPSATSDIELNRVEGVHGPRRLDVVVVRD
jgi:L-lactate dehydrogenase complex protein LldG